MHQSALLGQSLLWRSLGRSLRAFVSACATQLLLQLRLSRTTLEKRGQKANFDRTKICLFVQIEHHNIKIQRNPAKRENMQKSKMSGGGKNPLNKSNFTIDSSIKELKRC